MESEEAERIHETEEALKAKRTSEEAEALAEEIVGRFYFSDWDRKGTLWKKGNDYEYISDGASLTPWKKRNEYFSEDTPKTFTWRTTRGMAKKIASGEPGGFIDEWHGY